MRSLFRSEREPSMTNFDTTDFFRARPLHQDPYSSYECTPIYMLRFLEQLHIEFMPVA